MKPALLLLILALASCDLSMNDQSRTSAYRTSTLWPGGPPRRGPPPGTIAVDQPARAQALSAPPALTLAVLARGGERYAIFCSVCHGDDGAGTGAVVRHGFPRPPSFEDPRLRAATPRDIVAVITQGHGVMYSYAERIPPADRWAIAAHVKALQRARELEAQP